MRTYEEALAAARPGRPFGYYDELLYWQQSWCERCIHDTEEAINDHGGCPLIAVVVIDGDATPSEWMVGEEQERGPGYVYAKAYTCIEFRHQDDDGGGEPTPIPTPPGQDGLFEREDFEGQRCLKPLQPPAVVEMQTSGGVL